MMIAFKELLVEFVTRMLYGAIMLVGALMVWVIVNIVVPPIEVAIKPPVESLTFSAKRCVGSDLVATVRLNKAEYFGGSYAEYRGLTLKFETPRGKDIAWFEYRSGKTLPEKRNARNRPAGLHVFDLMLIDACHSSFYAYTEHVSPYTYLKLKMKFGPFTGEPGNTEISK